MAISHTYWCQLKDNALASDFFYQMVVWSAQSGTFLTSIGRQWYGHFIKGLEKIKINIWNRMKYDMIWETIDFKNDMIKHILSKVKGIKG